MLRCNFCLDCVAIHRYLEPPYYRAYHLEDGAIRNHYSSYVTAWAPVSHASGQTGLFSTVKAPLKEACVLYLGRLDDLNLSISELSYEDEDFSQVP